MSLSVAPGKLDDDEINLLSDDAIRQYGYTAIESRGLERFEDFEMAGKLLVLATKTGQLIGHLKMNKMSNSGYSTCTLFLPSGQRVFLPATPFSGRPERYIFGRKQFANKVQGMADNHVALNLADQFVSIDDLGGDAGVMVALDDIGENYVDHYCKVPMGEDGVLEGEINGARRLKMFTARDLGGCKKGYFSVNEDNGGYNSVTNRVVIADGLGGNLFSESAAALAVSYIKDMGHVSLVDAAWEAHHRLRFATHYIPNLDDKSNTVFAALKLKGDYVDIVTAGDTVIYVIRGGRVIYKTPRRNEYYEKVLRGEMTDREYYEKGLHRGDLLTKSLLTAHENGFDCVGDFRLCRGDILAGLGDGVDIFTPYQLENMIGGADNPDDIVDTVVGRVHAINQHGTYDREYLENGKIVSVKGLKAPGDNATVFGYVHN